MQKLIIYKTRFLVFNDKSQMNVLVNELIPFVPKRIYTVLASKESIRGGHAHLKLEQVIFCIKGKLKIEFESIVRDKKILIINEDECVYVPNLYWRKIYYEKGSILGCIANDIYKEEDYIRDYSDFIKISNENN